MDRTDASRGLTPSALDRLVDPDADRAGSRRGYTPQQMIDLVRRDLEDLLNTHQSDRGIPEEFRDTLFERFAQADSSDQRQRGGTGLGMAIAKQFTEEMNGTIAFQSTIDVGTQFFLEFPLASPPPAAD